MMKFIYRKLQLKYPGITDKDFRLSDAGDGIVKLDIWTFPAPRPDLAALNGEIADNVVQAELDQKQAGAAQDDSFKQIAAPLIKFVATLPGAPAALVSAANKLP